MRVELPVRCAIRIIALSLLTWAVGARSLCAQALTIDADVLLEGGLIFDGGTGAGVVGDLALRDDKIVAIGVFPRGRINLIIDCRGLVVAPGFIDLHTHSDDPILAPATRANVNYLTQGCTSVVTGNCGAGPIHVKPYLDKIDAQGAGTNVLHLLPQGALRKAVLDTARRAATGEEMSSMKRLAEQAMRDGAWGMSTGLIYVPSVYATTDELVEIAEVVARHGGIYASHIRGEGHELLHALREALEIGARAGLPVHVSHFKAAGRDVWGTLHVAAELIEKARQGGQIVTADQYPYAASSTSLEAMVIPSAARAGNHEALLARLKEARPGTPWYDEMLRLIDGMQDSLQIATYAPCRTWEGKRLARIAADEGRTPLEIVLEIVRGGGASVVSFGMSEADVRLAMQLPWVATASDGGAKIPGSDRPHPRNFGTFPRKIGRYAIEEQVLPLAAAMRSATGLPADILGLADRGYLRVGYAADVVAFEPAAFRDQATFDDPYRYSTGVRYLYVNGRPAIFAGTPTGALAGRALRKPPRPSKS